MQPLPLYQTVLTSRFDLSRFADMQPTTTEPFLNPLATVGASPVRWNQTVLTQPVHNIWPLRRPLLQMAILIANGYHLDLATITQILLHQLTTHQSCLTWRPRGLFDPTVLTPANALPDPNQILLACFEQNHQQLLRVCAQLHCSPTTFVLALAWQLLTRGRVDFHQRIVHN